MKVNYRKVIGTVIFIFLIALCSCASRSENSDIVIDTEQSYYLHFEIEEEKVIIKCHYVIYNHTGRSHYIKLCGDFEEDRQLGLVKESQLYAKSSIEDDDTCFKVSRGKNELDVVYVGTFGGKERKTNRLPPDTSIIISDVSDDSAGDS